MSRQRLGAGITMGIKAPAASVFTDLGCITQIKLSGTQRGSVTIDCLNLADALKLSSNQLNYTDMTVTLNWDPGPNTATAGPEYAAINAWNTAATHDLRNYGIQLGLGMFSSTLKGTMNGFLSAVEPAEFTKEGLVAIQLTITPTGALVWTESAPS